MTEKLIKRKDVKAALLLDENSEPNELKGGEDVRGRFFAASRKGKSLMVIADKKCNPEEVKKAMRETLEKI